jgi:integrase/recombinase XerD
MFERLLKRPGVLARHCGGPLAEERRRYLDHCAQLGMSDKTLRPIASYLLAITNYLRLADRPPDELISSAEIEAQAERWANRASQSAQSTAAYGGQYRFLVNATHWLKFLGRWQAPVAESRPYADRVAAFADHMNLEQGFSPHTIHLYCWIAQEVLDHLCASRRLEEVTTTQVDEVLIHKLEQGSYARITVRGYASALRAFFRYAQAQGWCRHGLAEAIQGPRLFAQDTLPSGPSWVDLQRLLASTEGDKPKAIRDRAILLLLAVYGCRAGEAARLRLDDLDWECERIQFTRSKSSQTQTYPLSRIVGDALLRYLQEVRPSSLYREVFLRLNAPFRPLIPTSLWPVVALRLRALGISLRHYGPHALRHACATHLLEQGFTLKQIGDHLGHRHPDTTRIYAKVDVAGLRQVANLDIGDLL